MHIPVYVINLKSSVKRRDHISGILSNLGISFEIVEAVDGSLLSAGEIRSKSSLEWKYGSRTRNLLSGEIGCTLSHFNIYRKMNLERIEAACILEDDAEPDKNFRNFLDHETLANHEWDILFLGHHSIHLKNETASINKKKLKTSGYSVGEPMEIPVGSYGYIIKREPAATILKNGYPVRKPLDFYTGNASALGINVKVLSPPCVHHNYDYLSTIYNEKEIVFNDSLLESFRKIVRKAYKWIPFLQPLRVLIAAKMNSLVILLRRAGLLKRTYAKFD